MSIEAQAFKGFKTWENLLDFLRRERRQIFYHAPMDFRPKHVQATNVGGDTIRVWSLHGAFDPFEASRDHLNRFKRHA